MSRYVVFALVLMTPAIVLQAGENPIISGTSKIDAVTVYSDRAMVKRLLQVDLPQGKSIIEVANLPGGLLNESLRVSGSGTSKAKISGVRVEVKYLEKSSSQEIRDLEEELTALNKREKVIKDRMDILNKKTVFVDNISSTSAEKLSGSSGSQSTTNWAEILNFMGLTLETINSESRSLEDESAALAPKTEIIQKRLEKLRSQKTKLDKSAFIEINSDTKGSIGLEIFYVIYGAGWTPEYDVEASSDTNEIKLVMNATVSQHTGEDWNDVRLELTTANPSINAVPKTLGTWYLDLTKRVPQSSHGLNDVIVVAKQPLIDKYITSAASMTSESGFVQAHPVEMETAHVSEQLLSTSFDIGQRESIPSEYGGKKVSIETLTLKGDYEYYCVPSLSYFVYLKTVITNNANFPLLSGDARVFLDGNFVHSTVIPMVVPKEEFDLYLGIDDKIKVKRELVGKFTDEAGILSSKDKLSYSFKITVENFRKNGQKITVLDQYPVSRNDQIKVKMTAVSPETSSGELDVSKGLLRWIFDLEPDRRREINFAYEIKYPGDYEILGLQ